jgi:tyrosine-protein kinase
MRLRAHVGVVRRHWRVVALLTLIAAGAAAVRSFQQTPVYEATAAVLVRPLSATAIETGLRPDQVLNMDDERRIMQSEAVAAIARRTMRVTASPAELLEHVTADVAADSQIVRVHFRYLEAATAQRGANAFARAYLAFRKQQMTRQVTNSRSNLQRQIATVTAKKARQDEITSPDSSATPDQRRNALELSDSYSRELADLDRQLATLEQLEVTPGSVIEPAQLPTAPSGPGRLLSIGLTSLLGLVAGLLVAVVQSRTDTRLRGRDELVERLDRPVLGQIPRLGRWRRRAGWPGWSRRPSSSLVVLDEPDSPAAEAYRALRTRLTRLADQLDLKSIMVVSPGAGEGKSTTAANLAVALAESGRDVLLVSADLRRPRIHEFFGVPNKTGLSNLLTDDLAASAAEPGLPPDGQRSVSQLWSVAPHLWLIGSGPPPPHPSALLDSTAMREFLKEQRDLFDIVLLDCPPALAADSLALASLVDGVLVVADAKQTERSAVSRLHDELGQPGGKLIGSVLNRASGGDEGFYYRAAYDAG